MRTPHALRDFQAHNTPLSTPTPAGFAPQGQLKAKWRHGVMVNASLKLFALGSAKQRYCISGWPRKGHRESMLFEVKHICRV
jgi:hypothetical protein